MSSNEEVRKYLDIGVKAHKKMSDEAIENRPFSDSEKVYAVNTQTAGASMNLSVDEKMGVILLNTAMRFSTVRELSKTKIEPANDSLKKAVFGSIEGGAVAMATYINEDTEELLEVLPIIKKIASIDGVGVVVLRSFLFEGKVGMVKTETVTEMSDFLYELDFKITKDYHVLFKGFEIPILKEGTETYLLTYALVKK